MAPRKKPTTEKDTKNLAGSTIIDGAMVNIRTDSALFSGTNAKVSLKIGNSGKVLDTPNYNDFERKCNDLYSLYPLVVGGTLDDLRKSSIELSHDGSGRSPDWKVAQIIIYLLPKGSPAGGIWPAYKDWTGIGWLKGNQDGRTVILQ